QRTDDYPDTSPPAHGESSMQPDEHSKKPLVRRLVKPPDYQWMDYERLPQRLPYRSSITIDKRDREMLPWRTQNLTERPIPPAPPRVCENCGMVLWTGDDKVKRARQEGLCKASNSMPE